MPSSPPSPLASNPLIVVTRIGFAPAATRRIRPVVRSPTNADVPSGSGANPVGAARQAAMTAGSAGRHGSAGAVVLGDGFDETRPEDGGGEDAGAVLGARSWGSTGV